MSTEEKEITNIEPGENNNPDSQVPNEKTYSQNTEEIKESDELSEDKMTDMFHREVNLEIAKEKLNLDSKLEEVFSSSTILETKDSGEDSFVAETDAVLICEIKSIVTNMVDSVASEQEEIVENVSLLQDGIDIVPVNEAEDAAKEGECIAAKTELNSTSSEDKRPGLELKPSKASTNIAAISEDIDDNLSLCNKENIECEAKESDEHVGKKYTTAFEKEKEESQGHNGKYFRPQLNPTATPFIPYRVQRILGIRLPGTFTFPGPQATSGESSLGGQSGRSSFSHSVYDRTSASGDNKAMGTSTSSQGLICDYSPQGIITIANKRDLDEDEDANIYYKPMLDGGHGASSRLDSNDANDKIITSARVGGISNAELKQNRYPLSRRPLRRSINSNVVAIETNNIATNDVDRSEGFSGGVTSGISDEDGIVCNVDVDPNANLAGGIFGSGNVINNNSSNPRTAESAPQLTQVTIQPQSNNFGTTAEGVTAEMPASSEEIDGAKGSGGSFGGSRIHLNSRQKTNPQIVTVTVNKFKKMVEQEVHARLSEVCDYYEARQEELWEERECLIREYANKENQCKQLQNRLSTMINRFNSLQQLQIQYHMQNLAKAGRNATIVATSSCRSATTNENASITNATGENRKPHLLGPGGILVTSHAKEMPTVPYSNSSMVTSCAETVVVSPNSG